MTPDVVIVPGRLEHAFVLATTMQTPDVAELEVCGLSPLEGLLQAVKLSEVSCAALHDDVVGAMFGVQPLSQGVLGGADCLWFLTGHLFAEKPMSFFRAARRAVGVLLQRYPVLGNLIDARHTSALRFAQAMGAELFPAVPFGRAGAPFVPIRIRRH